MSKTLLDIPKGAVRVAVAHIKRLENGKISIHLMGYSDKIIIDPKTVDYSKIPEIELIEDKVEVVEEPKETEEEEKETENGN